MRASRFNWLRTSVVAALSLGAAAAGVLSAKAAANVEKFTFKGGYVQWDVFRSDESGTTSTWGFASEGVTGPGKPQPVANALVSLSQRNADWSQSSSVFASGEIDPSDIVVSKQARKGSVDADLSGTETNWDWNAGTVTSEPVEVDLSVNLVGGDQYGRDRVHSTYVDRSEGLRITTRFHGVTNFNPTGTITVSTSSGTESTFQVTEDDYAVISYVRQGRMVIDR